MGPPIAATTPNRALPLTLYQVLRQIAINSVEAEPGRLRHEIVEGYGLYGKRRTDVLLCRKKSEKWHLKTT
jgi:hypothetical protein